MSNTKSFVFNVAKQSESTKWIENGNDAKACGNPNPIPGGPDGKGCGGCTFVDFGWGREPTTTPGFGGDGPAFC